MLICLNVEQTTVMFFNRTMEKGAHGLVKQTRQCCNPTEKKNKKKRSVDDGRPAVGNGNYSSDSEGLYIICAK